jgi:hypothetical protein
VFGDTIGTFPYSRRMHARIQIRNFLGALERYRNDTGDYPEENVGLSALDESPGGVDWCGPYLLMRVPLDPWGRAYVYRRVSGDLPVVVSLGGAEGPESRGRFAKSPFPTRPMDPWPWIRLAVLCAGLLGLFGYPLLPALLRRLNRRCAKAAA